MSVLYGVGAGPGDPELITVKGARLLATAPVVFVPVRERGARSQARAVAEQYVDAGGANRVVELVYPFVRDAARLEAARTAGAATIVGELDATGWGVFVTEGDPMLYSTFLHTCAALRAYPRVETVAVPGVSSITAAAAVARAPLGLGDERLAVVPTTADGAALMAALRDFDTVVFLKVSVAWETLLDALEATGRMEGAVWVGRVGQAEQAMERDLRRLRGARPDYFSLVIARGPNAAPASGGLMRGPGAPEGRGG